MRFDSRGWIVQQTNDIRSKIRIEAPGQWKDLLSSEIRQCRGLDAGGDWFIQHARSSWGQNRRVRIEASEQWKEIRSTDGGDSLDSVGWVVQPGVGTPDGRTTVDSDRPSDPRPGASFECGITAGVNGLPDQVLIFEAVFSMRRGDYIPLSSARTVAWGTNPSSSREP